MFFIMKIVVSQNLEVVKLIREGLKRTGGYCPCLIEKMKILNVYAKPLENKPHLVLAIVAYMKK